MTGQTLSHFRILGKVGEGGMGVVYRAEDVTLQRTVALKVLPHERLGDEERRLRFLREARAAAAVTHPNIATVYEVGEAEGTVFIAMELIEGQTLRDVIGGAPLPAHEVLRLGIEIAEGLAAAHRAHVIHRDLKPENVITTPDGRLKILDFGLAKLLDDEDEPETPERSKLATVSREMTRAGRVMGTAAYMSPEQARGLPVDARTDLFSFGIVLYEMVTGKPPFHGSTPMDTLTAILREEPVPAIQRRPDTPRELERIIGKCLEKEPGERYQDTRDLVVDLRHLKRDSDSQQIPRGDLSAGSSRVSGWLARWRMFATVVVGMAALAVAGWVWFNRGSPKPGIAFQSMTMTSLARIDGLVNAALSPDGRFLAYIVRKGAKYSLSIRQVSTASEVQVLPPQDSVARGITFSPDGEHLYFLARDPESTIYSNLYRVPTLGGTPRKVLFDVDSPVGFSRDGTRIAFVRGQVHETPPHSSLIVADRNGTGQRVVATKPLPRWLDPGTAPSWSPDGRRVAALITNAAGVGPHTIAEFAVADGRESRIGAEDWDTVGALAWFPDGSGIALIGGRFGEATRQVWFINYPDGGASRITNDLNAYVGLSLSGDGKTLATVQMTGSGDLWDASADDPSAARQITAGEGPAPIAYFAPSIGAKRVAAMPSGSVVFATARGGTSHVYEIAANGTGRRPLTPDGLDTWSLLMARGAGRILVTAAGSDRIPHVFRVDADTGNVTQLTRGDGEVGLAISPDASRMIYVTLRDLTFWKTSPAGRQPTALNITNPTSVMPAYAPDGRTLWIGTYREQAGLARIALEQIPADGGAPLRSIDWPDACVFSLPWAWAPAGDALTCIGDLDGVFNLWNQPLVGGKAQPFTHFRSGHVLDFDWSPDGRRLLMWRGNVTADVVLITNFK